MTETAPEAPAQESPETQTDPAKAEAAGTTEQPQAGETDWKAEARKWEQRAKENTGAKSELEKLRKSAMTETEKAVAEAEERGRLSATSDFSQRLARTEFDALAGRRNPDVDTEKVLEFVNLAKFVGEDGEPDKKAIAAAVERLVPAPSESTPSFDGGSRTTAPAPQGMSQIIRKAAGRA